MSVEELLAALREKRTLTLLEVDSISAGKETALEDSKILDLQYIRTLAITIDVQYDSAATTGVTVYLRSSVHGGAYDTDPYTSFDPAFAAGQRVLKTVSVDPNIRYLKVTVKNRDTARPTGPVTVYATYGR